MRRHDGAYRLHHGDRVVHGCYRIQVGDEYTYRDGAISLDRLVQSLLDNAPTIEEIDRLLAKAKGQKPPEPPPRRGPVPPEQIQITVEKIPPPRPPEKEKWRKVGE